MPNARDILNISCGRDLRRHKEEDNAELRGDEWINQAKFTHAQYHTNEFCICFYFYPQKKVSANQKLFQVFLCIFFIFHILETHEGESDDEKQ